MKLFFSTLLFFISISLVAQNDNSIEMYVSPNYTNYTNKLVDEEGGVTYNFGVGYNFKSGKKWNLTAGLRFADFVTKYSEDNFRWGTQFVNGEFDPEAPSGEDITGITFKNHYYFLEMPVGIKYRVINEKIKFFVEPTINPALFLTHRNDITKRYEQEPDDLEISSDGFSDVRKFNFFGEIGIGIEVPVGENLSIQVRPSARMQLLSVSNNSQSESKFYSLGMKVGVLYNLGE